VRPVFWFLRNDVYPNGCKKLSNHYIESNYEYDIIFSIKAKEVGKC